MRAALSMIQKVLPPGTSRRRVLLCRIKRENPRKVDLDQLFVAKAILFYKACESATRGSLH